MRGHDITEQPSRVRRAGLGGRRAPQGPWPVRPRVVPVGVRPVQPARPASPPVVRRSSALALLSPPRVLVRRAVRPARPAGVRERARRALAAASLAVAVATAVVLLGLLAGFVAESRSGAPAGAAGSTAPTATASAFTSSGSAVTVTVTVDSHATVWDVARQVAPAASGPELAALAERIVVDNGLSSVRVSPGQQLRVTVG